MIVRFRSYYNGELWCAEAEKEDIFALGSSLGELMKNVELAARVHFSGRLPAGEGLHITLANETGTAA